jgi:hypothetical protein
LVKGIDEEEEDEGRGEERRGEMLSTTWLRG